MSEKQALYRATPHVERDGRVITVIAPAHSGKTTKAAQLANNLYHSCAKVIGEEYTKSFYAIVVDGEGGLEPMLKLPNIHFAKLMHNSEDVKYLMTTVRVIAKERGNDPGVIILDGHGFPMEIAKKLNKLFPTTTVIRTVNDAPGKLGDPLLLETSMFRPKEILYFHDSFVLARGLTSNNDICYACRWHPPVGLGYPNGFGRPQWFMLPFEYGQVKKTGGTGELVRVSMELVNIPTDIDLGTLVRTDGDRWSIVTALHANDKVLEIQDSRSFHNYPVQVTLSDIQETGEFLVKSQLAYWHQGKVCLWIDDDDHFVFSYSNDECENLIDVEEVSPSAFGGGVWTISKTMRTATACAHLDGWVLLKTWTHEEIFGNGGTEFNLIQDALNILSGHCDQESLDEAPRVLFMHSAAMRAAELGEVYEYDTRYEDNMESVYFDYSERYAVLAGEKLIRDGKETLQ